MPRTSYSQEGRIKAGRERPNYFNPPNAELQGEIWNEPPCFYHRAQLLISQGRAEAATDLFAEVLQVSRTMSNKNTHKTPSTVARNVANSSRNEGSGELEVATEITTELQHQGLEDETENATPKVVEGVTKHNTSTPDSSTSSGQDVASTN